ncbi:hypothetical protein AAE478_002373 [Parahypoxylon ruwenzoriense]
MDQGSREKTTRKDVKGKGVVRQNNLPAPSAEHGDRPAFVESTADTVSMLSRLSASTTKLANDMIPRNPSTTELASTFPSSKAESSRAARGAGANEALSYSNNTTQGTVHDTFKSTGAQEYHISSESEFSAFLESASALETTEPETIREYNYGKHSNHDSLHGQETQVEAVAATDGMDVANLLDSGYDEVEEGVLSLTENEQMALRDHVFKSSNPWGHRPQWGRWKYALNFFPNSESNDNGMQEYAELLGTSDLEEARSIWISQWERVLSNYTDEVWGGLSPLVDAAREELHDLTRSPAEAPNSGLKALHRLQQILGHLSSI